jgi:hypothetical protein
MTDRTTLSMSDQADLLAGVISKATRGTNGRTVVAWLTITDTDLEDLRHIERRMRRMSLHEAEIRKIVARGR